MTTNDDLFVRVLAQIEREPQTWDQSVFVSEADCGTAYCFAGWACAINGWESDALTGMFTKGDSIADPALLAEELLGISGWQDDFDRSHLFESDNTLNDLYRISAGHMGIDETVLRDKVRDALGGTA